jgi:adenine/guanine phosphoribosyltransferase-like PRPP-binding protein
MSYLSPYLSGKKIKELVIQCGNILPTEAKFDSIAVRGNSGLLMGSVLACEWDMDLVIVRKDEKSHSGNLVEGWGSQQRILIVDDFIESGKTIDLIYEAIMEKCDSPTIIGILLYASTEMPDEFPYYTHPDNTQFPVWNVPREATLAAHRRMKGRKL